MLSQIGALGVGGFQLDVSPAASSTYAFTDAALTPTAAPFPLPDPAAATRVQRPARLVPQPASPEHYLPFRCRGGTDAITGGAGPLRGTQR